MNANQIDLPLLLRPSQPTSDWARAFEETLQLSQAPYWLVAVDETTERLEIKFKLQRWYKSAAIALIMLVVPVGVGLAVWDLFPNAALAKWCFALGVLFAGFYFGGSIWIGRCESRRGSTFVYDIARRQVFFPRDQTNVPLGSVQSFLVVQQKIRCNRRSAEMVTQLQAATADGRRLLIISGQRATDLAVIVRKLSTTLQKPIQFFGVRNGAIAEVQVDDMW
ncbi:MAG: hypothetical protein RL380_1327 [Verrucomicrobiota bacterium]|jgi:hypothetical protein